MAEAVIHEYFEGCFRKDVPAVMKLFETSNPNISIKDRFGVTHVGAEAIRQALLKESQTVWPGFLFAAKEWFHLQIKCLSTLEYKVNIYLLNQAVGWARFVFTSQRKLIRAEIHLLFSCG